MFKVKDTMRVKVERVLREALRHHGVSVDVNVSDDRVVAHVRDNVTGACLLRPVVTTRGVTVLTEGGRMYVSLEARVDKMAIERGLAAAVSCDEDGLLAVVRRLGEVVDEALGSYASDDRKKDWEKVHKWLMRHDAAYRDVAEVFETMRALTRRLGVLLDERGSRCSSCV